MRKGWLAVPMVAGALAIGVLAAGVVSVGSISAQEAENEQTSKRQMFMSRVADILNVDEDNLQSAFQQAKTEIHDEMIEARLDGLIEAGTITEDDKTAILDWYDAKPESLGGLGMIGKRGHGFGKGGNVEDRLARAVENGVLTQEEADEVAAWYESKPEVLDEISLGNHHRGGRFHGKMHGRFFGPRGGERQFEGNFQGRSFGRFGAQGLNGAGNGENVPQTPQSSALTF